MANSDIPNTNTQATANSINQKMVPTGNVPFWQQQASSMNNFPIGGQFRPSPIGPFGPTGPSQRPMNNFTPRPSLGGFPGMVGGLMGMRGQPQPGFGGMMNGIASGMGNMVNRGYGGQPPSQVQPLINSGISGLLSGMGMQQQPPQQSPNMGGGSNEPVIRNPQSY